MTTGSRARLAARLLGGITHPRRLSSLVLFVTDECNARCEFCFNDRLRRSGARGTSDRADPMSIAEYTRLAEQTPPLLQVIIGGGEPFMRHDLASLIALFADKTGAALFSIPTNGSLPQVTTETVAGLLTRCPRARFNIIVSLDAPEEIHDTWRGLRGCFRRAIKLLHALSALASRNPNLGVVINTVVTDESVVLLRPLYRRLRDEFGPNLPLHNLQVDQRATAPGENTAHRVELLRRALRVVAEERRQAGGGNYSPVARLYSGLINDALATQLTSPTPPHRCAAGDKLAVIMPDGTMGPCEPFIFDGFEGRDDWPNLRDYDYCPAALMATPRYRSARRHIENERCGPCAWTCATAASMILLPDNWRRMIGRNARRALS